MYTGHNFLCAAGQGQAGLIGGRKLYGIDRYRTTATQFLNISNLSGQWTFTFVQLLAAKLKQFFLVSV